MTLDRSLMWNAEPSREPAPDALAGREPLAANFAACRAALATLEVDDASSSWQETMIALARAARANGIPPDRFLGEFKSMVVQLPAFQGQSTSRRGELMVKFVALVADAFYSAPGD